jgi:hypothetical protein
LDYTLWLLAPVYNPNGLGSAPDPHIKGSIENVVVMLVYCFAAMVCMHIIILSGSWKNWQIFTLKILIGA